MGKGPAPYVGVKWTLFALFRSIIRKNSTDSIIRSEKFRIWKISFSYILLKKIFGIA